MNDLREKFVDKNKYFAKMFLMTFNKCLRMITNEEASILYDHIPNVKFEHYKKFVSINYEKVLISEKSLDLTNEENQCIYLIDVMIGNGTKRKGTRFEDYYPGITNTGFLQILYKYPYISGIIIIGILVGTYYYCKNNNQDIEKSE